jgi:hypothetical protein
MTLPSPATRARGFAAALVFTLAAAAVPALAQTAEPPAPPAPSEPVVEAGEAPAPRTSEPFHVEAEFKLNYRWSKDLSTPIFTPFPEQKDYGPLFQRTADPGSSAELSTLNVRAEGEITSGVFVKAEVHVLDLYNRNPTSSDDRIFLREAWVRFGRSPEPLKAASGSRAYVLLGLAPRFTKQVVRHLESYGLWGTAVGRFEQPQLQAGVSLGRHAHAKAMIGTGNPLFMRDTNALAGDNGAGYALGSPERVYETGFPILYDAKPTDVSFGRLEWGAGLGARFARGEKTAVDLLAWSFGRDLQDRVSIRGSSLAGDLDLLRGEGFPLPFHGDRKREYGLNVEAKAAGLRLFGQLVDQDIAGLKRRGFEADLSWLRRLNGLFLVGESPFLNWIQPTVRISYIDNRFSGNRNYPSLSVLWDWTKYDLGVRVGLVRGIDLTAEYSRHDATLRVGTLHPDEFLTTLRVGF